MTLRPTQILAIIDTREQRPLDLKLPCGTQLPSTRGTLATGDYSIEGLQNELCIERKSIDDLAMCCASERKRFEAELQRMLAYKTRVVVVEASLEQIEQGEYRSRIAPEAIVGSILAWTGKGIPFLLAGNRDKASEFVARLLYGTAKTYHKSMSSFLQAIKKQV
jgi:DNA excision repair protein ERCC-4